MIRMVKAKKQKEASTKKNTPVECLKRKRTELGTTSSREHTEKKTMKTKEFEREKTGKDDIVYCFYL